MKAEIVNREEVSTMESVGGSPMNPLAIALARDVDATPDLAKLCMGELREWTKQNIDSSDELFALMLGLINLNEWVLNNTSFRTRELEAFDIIDIYGKIEDIERILS